MRGGAPVVEADVERQWEVVEAFLGAERDGDFEALVAVLTPDVVARSAAGVTRGATAVASQAAMYAHLGRFVRRALVNEAAGLVVVRDGRVERVLSFAIAEGRIAAIDAVAEEDRLAAHDVTLLDA